MFDNNVIKHKFSDFFSIWYNKWQKILQTYVAQFFK
jgi:hypothetical protein